MLNILKKAFVIEYYRRNLGFFLFVFYMLFGMEQKPILFHRELIESIVRSKTELLVTIVVFLLYHLKCLYFITRRIKSSEYIFLAEMQSYSMFQQIAGFAFAYVLLAIPFTIYSCFIIAMGIKLKYILSAMIVLLFLLIVHAINIFVCYKTIQNSFTQKQKLSFLDKLPTVKKSMLLLPLWYSINNGQMRLITVKFFSLLLLSVMCVWNRNDYQFSDFLLFFQFSIAAHSALTLDYVEFFESKFFIRRNLPLPVWKIFLSYLLCYCIIAVPEILSMFYFGIGQQPPTNTSIMAIIYVGELLLFTAVLYEKGMTKERYFAYAGAIVVLMLLLAAFKIFLFAAIAILIICFSLFQTQFYKYEPNAEDKNQEK
ncbi:hypothetical protein [Arachidicoccus ginsenosidimutans]|uniref:hypothetical protein n=1 Tax=Arachidicoccus sp. BS20 TaxID=1850526 RepID=UPI0012E6F53E|nr:hypothetical protein [Arachidicoccus sp. BS20]